jgi:hypothetical protein
VQENAFEYSVLAGDEISVNITCQRVIRAYANKLDPHFHSKKLSLLPLQHGIES